MRIANVSTRTEAPVFGQTAEQVKAEGTPDRLAHDSSTSALICRCRKSKGLPA